MSGLYNIVLGDGSEETRGQIITALLGLTEVGRFRDAWSEKNASGEVVLAIYTRNGGPNRTDGAWGDGGQGEAIALMQANQFYIEDADDTFDETYATFRFRIPTAEEQLALDRLHAEDVGSYHKLVERLTEDAFDEPVNMDERWKQAIDRVGTGDLSPAEKKLGEELVDKIGGLIT